MSARGHIRRRGTNSWELKFDASEASGKRVTRYVSFRGTRKAAQAKLASLIVATENGTFVEPAKVTVGQFVSDRVDQWEAAGSITARTASRYRDLVRCQIIPFIGTKQIQKLTTLDIEQWHGTLKTSGRANGKGGLAARSIGHCHRLLRAALRDSTKHGLTVKNVALAQSAPKVKTAEKVIVRDVPAFIESLRRDSRLFVPGMVALFTGMRLGEVLALRWSRVDLERKTIEVKEAVEQIANDEIRIKGPKTVAGVRTITLPDVLVETLRQHRKEQQELRLKLGVGRLPDDALLFASVDGSLASQKYISRLFGEFADRIGMPDLTFHGLRHSHASQLIDHGVDVVTISKRLGHASPDMTLKVYSHLFKLDDGKAADAINRMFGKA